MMGEKRKLPSRGTDAVYCNNEYQRSLYNPFLEGYFTNLQQDYYKWFADTVLEHGDGFSF